MSKTLLSFLEANIRRRRADIRHSHKWNVGVEHEFFLFGTDKKPATLEESQKLFKKISERDSWTVYEYEGADKINKLTRQVGNNGYSQLKYDHEPHLLEVASCFFENLGDLERELRIIFSDIASACTELGYECKFLDHLEYSAADSRVTPNTISQIQLREFRVRANQNINREISDELANYAAVIAATQIHIGGRNLDWFEYPELVNKLYCYEPQIQGWANLGTQPNKRWKPYFDVYHGYALLGFPDFETWSFKNWIMAMQNTPVKYTVGNRVTAPLLTDLKPEKMSEKELEKVWKETRDLQIVRPKLFGSLEFRADPAQPNIERIMALATLRLATCQIVLEGKHALPNDYKKSHDLWWSQALGGVLEPSQTFLKLIIKHLELSEPNYLRYLEPYREYRLPDAA